jgi:hypothetical protein
MPVTDPEKLLKTKNQPSKTKYHSEPSSSCSLLFDTKDLTPNNPEVRSEIHSTSPSVHKSKGPLESSSTVDIPTFLRQNFPVSPDSKECVTNSFSTPKSMAGIRGGGGGQGNVPPPRVFEKVGARYAPLVLPIPLHDLPGNYIKNLPKFTGEGDLTAAEHINFFD